MENFHIWFRQLRINAGFESQRALAEASKVHHTSIAQIEKGGRRPSTDTLKKLAPHLKVPYESLLLAAGHLYGGGKDNEVIVPELPQNELAELEDKFSELEAKFSEINVLMKRLKK